MFTIRWRVKWPVTIRRSLRKDLKLRPHETLKEYIVLLRCVGISRLLEQLGRVYDLMRLEDMKRVASFTYYTDVEETTLTVLKIVYWRFVLITRTNDCVSK